MAVNNDICVSCVMDDLSHLLVPLQTLSQTEILSLPQHLKKSRDHKRPMQTFKRFLEV
jgi:hypothetical protein